MNYSENYSDFEHPNSFSSLYMLGQITIPLICAIGFVGNILTTIVYFDKDMRKLSCSFYLGTRAISDNGFILTILAAWLDFIDIRIFHVIGFCQIMLFLSYVCSFISVWCVVFVTWENFILVCVPDKAPKLCRVKVAKYVVVSFVVLGTMLYTFPLWGMTVANIEGRDYCMTRAGEVYPKVESILVNIDTIITLIIPLFIILILLIRILRTFYMSRKIFSRGVVRRDSNTTLGLHYKRSSITSLHSKVTKLLSSVSICFLVLHSPNHLLRLKVMIENLIYTPHIATDTDRRLQYAFSIVFYLNFAVNWIVYIVSGSKFRCIFFKKFCAVSVKRRRNGVLRRTKKNSVDVREEVRRLATDNRDSQQTNGLHVTVNNTALLPPIINEQI